MHNSAYPRIMLAAICFAGWVLVSGGCPLGGSPATALPGSTSIHQLETTDAAVGGTGMLRVTLHDPVAAATDITLSSSDPTVLTVPATATVVKGSDTAEVSFTAVGVGSAAVTAQLSGSAQTATARVVQNVYLASVSALWVPVQTGAAVDGELDLNVVAPAEVTVTLTSSDPAVASVPSSVVIRQYNDWQSFPILAGAPGRATITASYGTTTLSADVDVVPDAVLTYLDLERERALVGAAVVLTPNLSAIPAAATTVNLTSSNPAVAAVPANVTIAPGEMDVAVNIRALAAGTTVLAAQLGGTTVTRQFTVVSAPALEEFWLPARIQLGGPAPAVDVSLDVAPFTATTVTLTSSDPNVVAVPASVVVQPGHPSAPVPLNVLSAGNAIITAQLGASSLAAQITVLAVPSIDYENAPDKMQVGAVDSAYFYLTADVLADTPVTITNSNPAVISAPAAALIFAERDSAEVPIQALAVGSANLTFEVLGQTRTVTIVVVAVPTIVYVSASNVKIGAATSLSVQLDAIAAKDQVVTLTNSSPAKLAVPATITIPAGSTSAAVSVIGLAAGDATITATLGASSVPQTVTVTP